MGGGGGFDQYLAEYQIGPFLLTTIQRPDNTDKLYTKNNVPKNLQTFQNLLSLYYIERLADVSKNHSDDDNNHRQTSQTDSVNEGVTGVQTVPVNLKTLLHLCVLCVCLDGRLCMTALLVAGLHTVGV